MKRIAAGLAKVAFVSAALALGAVASAWAQPVPQIIRGTVTAVRPDGITIRPNTGKPVVVALAPNWTVAVMKPVKVDAIVPGSFIGSAEMPQADGTGRSIEVHVFPPGVKMGEGHYGWDLRQGSMMTNGTVGKVMAGHHGQELDVAYTSGTRHMVVPRGTPIVQITGGTQAMIHKGSKVFLIVRAGPGGGLITNSLSVGEGGRAPPM